MDVPHPQSSFELKLTLNENSGLTDVAKRNRDTLIHAYTEQIAGNWDAWWGIFDKDVVFSEAASLPYGCTLKGLEQTKTGVAGMFDAWSHLKVTIEEFTAAGDLVIAYIQMTATSRKTGQVFDRPIAEVFRFHDGKVVEWHPIYWDTHEVRKLCGVDG